MWQYCFIALFYIIKVKSVSLEHDTNLFDSDISAIEIGIEPPVPVEPQKIDFRIQSPDKENPKTLNLILNGQEETGLNFNMEVNVRSKPEELSEFRRRQRPALRIRNNDPGIITKNNLKIRMNASDTINFPYMAAIIINGRLWCSGTLVDENWVLTAAHCLNYVLHVSPLKSLGDYVKVRVGSSRAHEGGQLYDVVGAVRHPKFEEEPVPHADVALLKLSGIVPVGPDANIIKIYEGIREPFPQSFIVVSGWGATRGTDTAFRDHTSDMRTGRLKVRSQSYCIDAYQLVNGFQFTQDFFCASLRNGTRDACLFDAGAPAVQQNRLMGIMSFGPEHCGHEFQPAVFIKAFYFKDFVKSTISSYKTTQELIAAMQEADPDVRLSPLNAAGQEGEAILHPHSGYLPEFH